MKTTSVRNAILRKPRTLIRCWRLFGFTGLLREVANGIAAAIGLQRAVVFVRTLSDETPACADRVDVQFAFLPIELLQDELLAQTDWTITALRAKSTANRRFFVGAVNGRQCYFSIVNSHDFVIGERHKIQFCDDRIAYVGGCFTASSARGRGIYPRALCSLARELACEGKKWLVLHVETVNQASIRGVLKAGFRPVAKSTVFKVGGKAIRTWRVLNAAECPPFLVSKVR